MMQNGCTNLPKLRPFAKGIRGFYFLDVQALNVKERHFTLPLVIATFIMQSIAFIILPSQVRTMLNFLLH